MLQSEYIKFINALLESTNQGALSWTKGDPDRRLSYATWVTEEKSVLIDKYYSIGGEQPSTCLNLTIYQKNGDLFDEIVLCKPVAAAEDYSLLEKLYNLVDSQLRPIEQPTIPPVLNELTESLHQKMQHHAHP